MRRVIAPLAVAVVLVLVITGGLFALGRAMGVGPFAPGVSTSWLFLAISRSGEDGDAREIEVIDLTSGERQLFPIDDRAFDLALSRDRRTLYVGTTNGRVLELDALRGTFLDEIKLSATGDVRRIVVLPDGRRLIAVTIGALDATASLVELGDRRESAKLALGNRLIGRSVAGKDVVLSSSDRASVEQLLLLDLDPFRVRADIVLTSVAPGGGPRTAAPSLILAGDGSIVALSPWGLRLSVIAPGSSDRRTADIPFGGLSPSVFFARARLILGFDGDLVLTREERVIHFCVGTAQAAERSIAPVETLRVERVGSECGRFARLDDGRIYLAVRGKAELHELDAATGASRRTLALAGFPQRVAY